MMSTTITTSSVPNTEVAEPKQARSWRDVLPIYPAANMFPLMKETDPGALDELAVDIKQHDLKNPIALWAGDTTHVLQLLDGRNRLDAMERAGVCLVTSDGKFDLAAVRTTILFSRETDPHAYVVSVNINRRHLTADDKRKIIADLIKANPQRSDRQIAKLVDASPTTVGDQRRKTCPGLDTSIDTKGHTQPRHKPARKPPAKDPAMLVAADRACARAERNRRHQAADSANVSAQPPEAAPLAPAVSSIYRALVDAWSSATLDDRQRFLTRIGAAFIEAQPKSRTQVANDIAEISAAAGRAVSPAPRGIDDMGDLSWPGGKEIATLTLIARSQDWQFKPMMRALEAASKITDWSHHFLVAENVKGTDRPNFNWRDSPFRRYENFKDFYARELEATWGKWDDLQRTWSRIIKGEQPAPAPDGLSIPPFLRRAAP
jgi:hypothetical protein